jgi:hypothetical protein
MHNGSRAFYFLMALAATGAECASAATPAPDVDAGHYRVETKLMDSQCVGGNKFAITLPTVVVANHILAVIVVSHVIELPSGNSGMTDIQLTVRPGARDSTDGRFQVSFVRSEMYPESTSSKPFFHVQRFATSIPQAGSVSEGWSSFQLPAYDRGFKTYDADGRRLASIADANARQLLFVKITRG